MLDLYSPPIVPPLSPGSETKIPLWRWQRMMIFMLANTVSCIVTSVLLNVVDHRQVRRRSACARRFTRVSADCSAVCLGDVLFLCRAAS